MTLHEFVPVAGVALSLLVLSPACGEEMKLPSRPVPRHRMAPIRQPYFFAWWNAPAPSHKHFEQVLPPTHQTFESLANEADFDWWLGRGVWPFGWSWGTQTTGPYASAEAYVEYLLEYVNKGAPGICFDEWVGFDEESQDLTGTPEKEKYPGNPRNRMLAEACRRVKERHPDFFIAAFTHMQSDALVEALKEGWVDLAVIESYVYVAKEPAWTPELARWRLGNAVRAGVAEKAIPAFWISPEDETFSPEFIEKWVTTFRREFPQMPGLAPLFPAGHDTADPRVQSLARACDRILKKHYLDPAPRVQVVEPEDGASVDSSTTLRARADRPVARWRLYSGADLVTESEEGQSEAVDFPLDDLSPGPHVLTVHAITQDWLRGAEQIYVSCVGG